jgi:hypothetical protein
MSTLGGTTIVPKFARACCLHIPPGRRETTGPAGPRARGGGRNRKRAMASQTVAPAGRKIIPLQKSHTVWYKYVIEQMAVEHE